MSDLTLRQKLTLAAWLMKHIEKDIRKGQLNPEAVAEMTPGERLAAKFGGQLAAWVSMPQPSTRVSDHDKLAAWCRKHLPQALYQVERCRPETATALVDDVKRQGGWLDVESGEVIPVDGITTGDPSPRVDLEDCAGDVIMRAWPEIRETAGVMLALPAGEGDGPA